VLLYPKRDRVFSPAYNVPFGELAPLTRGCWGSFKHMDKKTETIILSSYAFTALVVVVAFWIYVAINFI